jgi:hypothetical protein
MTEIDRTQSESVTGGLDPFTVGLSVGSAIAIWEWGKKKKWWR